MATPATREAKIVSLISDWGARRPELAALGARCLEDGTSFSTTQKLFLEALALEHGQGSRATPDRSSFRTERLGDLLAREILGDLPLARGEEKTRRLRNADEAGAEVDVGRHGLLRGIAEATSPKGGADISYRAFSGGSQFPAVVRDAFSLLLASAWQGEERPWEPITTRILAKDFKPSHVVKADVLALQETGELVPVGGGGAASEDQSYTLKTYARSVDIGRKLLVDDELGALRAAAEGVAAASARTVGNAIFALLQSNPTLGDGVALFHATHNNTAGSLSLDAAGLGATLARVRNQLSVSGERMNLRPDVLLCAPGAEAVARGVLGAFGAHGEDIRLLIEPRLSPSTTYYAIASGAAGLGLAALGRDSLRPSVEGMVPQWLGTRFLIALHFAPLIIDFRPLARATA